MKNFINRCLHLGAEVVSATKFELPIPPAPWRAWKPGCLLIMPEFVPMAQHLAFPNGTEGELLFVVVKVVFPDGYTCYDKLFLSTLFRKVRVGDRFVSNHGTAMDYIRSFPNLKEAFMHLEGRPIEIASDEVYETQSPDGRLRKSHIFCFNLVGEYKLAA